MRLWILNNFTQVHNTSQNFSNASRALQAFPYDFDENQVYRKINGLLYFLEVQVPRELMNHIIWLGSNARNVIQDCRFDGKVVFGKNLDFGDWMHYLEVHMYQSGSFIRDFCRISIWNSFEFKLWDNNQLTISSEQLLALLVGGTEVLEGGMIGERVIIYETDRD